MQASITTNLQKLLKVSFVFVTLLQQFILIKLGGTWRHPSLKCKLQVHTPVIWSIFRSHYGILVVPFNVSFNDHQITLYRRLIEHELKVSFRSALLSRSIPLNAISAWTQIHEFQLSHEGVSEVSERAHKWSEQASEASVSKCVAKLGTAQWVSGVCGASERM